MKTLVLKLFSISKRGLKNIGNKMDPEKNSLGHFDENFDDNFDDKLQGKCSHKTNWKPDCHKN